MNFICLDAQLLRLAGGASRFSACVVTTFVMMASCSYSFAQADNIKLAAEICGEGLRAVAAAKATAFTAGDYSVQITKDADLTIQRDGRIVARLGARDYASYTKCLEQMERTLNSRPPGPIDPGGPKVPR